MSTRTVRLCDALATPHVLPTFSAALIGRAAYALVLLPLLYAVSDATGSIAQAGVAVALYGAGASFLAPARAWFIARHGARPVLGVLVLLFGGAVAMLAITSLSDGPSTLLMVLAVAAGAVAPPIGPTMRVAWGVLVPEGDLLRKGLSFDAVVEELLYLVGPAVAGLVLAVIDPGFALFVPAVLVVVGGLLFVATPTVGAMRRHPRGETTERRRSLLAERRFVAVLLPALVAGSISGSLSVAVPAVLADHGGAAAAGVALGLFAGGSAIGGLVYGAVKVPGSPARQLIALALGLLTLSSLIAMVTGAVAVSVVVAVAGVFFSPVMIVAYMAAHTAGGEHRQNAATTWVNTSHNVGGAVGSALAGVLIAAAGMPFAVAVMAMLALLLLAASGMLARQR